MLTILLGLAAALSWGAGDFSGGLISRHTGAVRSALYVEACGLLPLVLLAGVSGQIGKLSFIDWIICGVAGVLGCLGLVALYAALANGSMSIAAPVASLTSAGLPLIVGGLRDGWPPAVTLAGFGLALLAIWLIAQPGDKHSIVPAGWGQLGLPLLAGLGFGSYYILINLGSRNSLFEPLIAVRVAGSTALLIFAGFKRQLQWPPRSIWPLLSGNTVFDIGGSLLYILASQVGRMDIAALLGSLYSGATVLLAWIFLREKINNWQRCGLLLCGVAIYLMTF